MDLNSQNVFLFFKGRVALYAILMAMKIKPGDEVILPGYTCVVVPNAIMYLGAKPVYIDIDPMTYNIDPEKIEENCGKSWHPDKTRAIIVQHTYGIPAKMGKLMDLAKKYNLHIIEDCCHSIGSKYIDKEIGTFGDAAFFSSQWTKPVTTGLGGWAIINNKKIRSNLEQRYDDFVQPDWNEKLALTLQYAVYSKLFKPSMFWFAQNTYRKLGNYGIAIGSSSKEELENKMPSGYRKKMSKGRSKLLNHKIKKVDDLIHHRKYIVKNYEEKLPSEAILDFNLDEKMKPVLLRYPVLVEDKMKVIREAQIKKIELGDWWLSPVHPNLERWERVGYTKEQCPIAEKICQHVINLPTHSKIEVKMAEKTIDFISPFIETYAGIK